MNTLDSPLEALTINYLLSYGVLTAINNVWAWIAVFTAAVSFWKIRANSVSVSAIAADHHHHRTFLPPPAKQVSHTKASFPSCTVAAEVSSISEAVVVAERPVFGCVECINEGATKGKYMVYYGAVEEECGDGDYDEVDDEVGGGMPWCENGWETVLRKKTEELGWYRYQDLTALDGNVVRLWDGCGRRKGYGYRSSGGSWH